MMPNDLRPDEVHLCAPAIVEQEEQAKLNNLSRNNAAFVYYCPRDFVLSTFFTAMHDNQEAIGSVGLTGVYNGTFCNQYRN
jgi:hypothetical protein